MQRFKLLALTAAVGSFLLFALEPMFTKMMLPTMGGAAHVWIAATMFYQLALFIGYSWAYLLSRYSPNLQWNIHIAAVVIALFYLPFSIPNGWSPSTDNNPIISMLLMMVTNIGPPFIVLAATAPLLQNWYSVRVVHHNPYNLYSYSNLGSFLALISYPLIIEPNIFLIDQSRAFALLYVLWGVTLAIAGWFATKYSNPALSPQVNLTPVFRPAAKDIFWWIFLSAVPTSLMLSTTSFITIDIGAAPLFWVIPLGIYLFSFIIAFSEKYKNYYKISALVYPYIFIVAMVALIGRALIPIPSTVGLFNVVTTLVILMTASLLCNCKLSDIKPDTSKSMIFYLSLSLGGVIGGFFNAVVAPMVFTDIYEYPLALILACAALPQTEWPSLKKIVILGLLASIAPIISTYTMQTNPNFTQLGLIAPIALIGILVFSQKSCPPALIGFTSVMFLSAILFQSNEGIILSIRNFYGVIRVRENSVARTLSHGTTIHGIMALEPAYRLSPLSYYSHDGGLGQATQVLNPLNERINIAVIGLGAGALKCYGDELWHFDFYEIDPTIADIASNTALFPYLTECPAKYSLFIGDGRLNIKKSKPLHYDEIVVDAFSSDSIPIHLITVEAVKEYIDKVKLDGVLLFHVTNRFLNLEPVVAAISDKLNLYSAVKRNSLRYQEESILLNLRAPSIVIALSPSQSKIDQLKRLGWFQPEFGNISEPWRDGRSNLISALSWQKMLNTVKIGSK